MKRTKPIIMVILASLLAFTTAAGLFAQTEADFQTKVNDDSSVTITKYVGWDSVVNIPGTIGGKKVTIIGKSAFTKQENLTSVTIPDSVTSIGESAFAVNKLTSVTFGKGIVSIGERAFYDNSLTSVTLPDTIKSIGQRAFSHNLLTKVTIPGFNTYIGALAFARNKQLTSVTLGSLCTFNNNRTYDNDTAGWISFTSFIEDDREGYPKDMDTNNIGERGKNLFFDYACNDRKAGTYTLDLKYRAPKKDGDFEYIETRYGAALTKYTGTPTAVRLPEKVGGIVVKHLANGLFGDDNSTNRKSIDRVLIPNSVTSIGSSAFYNQKLDSVVIPDSVTYIGVRAFSAGRSLTNVTIGKNVAVIETEAFYEQKLMSVVIPDSVKTIGDSAFSENELTSLTIGKGVTFIGTRLFSGNKLASIIIPDSVTYIGESAFSGNGLTSLTIDKGVTSIGEQAFYQQNLESVVIPDSVTYIGEEAFANNDALSITIGSGVTMGYRAIDDCVEIYESNGKKAGVYTREYRYGSWTYTER
jgi:hypothetical protein